MLAGSLWLGALAGTDGVTTAAVPGVPVVAAPAPNRGVAAEGVRMALVPGAPRASRIEVLATVVRPAT